jgi:hypothetical protein
LTIFEKRTKARRQTGPARPWRLSSAYRRRCQALFLSTSRGACGGDALGRDCAGRNAIQGFDHFIGRINRSCRGPASSTCSRTGSARILRAARSNGCSNRSGNASRDRFCFIRDGASCRRRCVLSSTSSSLRRSTASDAPRPDTLVRYLGLPTAPAACWRTGLQARPSRPGP